jgi:hypothetical protein
MHFTVLHLTLISLIDISQQDHEKLNALLFYPFKKLLDVLNVIKYLDFICPSFSFVGTD